MNKIKRRRTSSTIGENEHKKKELRGSARRLRTKEQCKRVQS
jgi:hypothetical protein